MSTLNKNISQTIKDFDAIREAIIDKGVDVPESTPTSEYSDKVLQIDGGISPSGTIDIIENGTYDVTQYAEADVDIADSDYGAMMTRRGSLSGTNFSISPEGEYSIPDDIDRIGAFAFAGMPGLEIVDLTNLEHLTHIGQYAFYPGIIGSEYDTSRLKNVILPEVTSDWMSLGDHAFEGCSSLHNLDLTSVQQIGADCFLHSGITTLYFSTKLTHLSWNAFEGSDNLTDIYYTGTQDQWENIGNIHNSKLSDTVRIHFEHT